VNSSNQTKATPPSRAEEPKPSEIKKHEEAPHVDSSKQSVKDTLTATLPNSKTTWASLAAARQDEWGPNVSKVTATSVLVQSYSTVNETPSDKKMPEKNVRPELDVSRCVFLKNLTPEMTEKTIRNALGRFGQIVSIDIFKNQINGYVEFTNSQSAKDAIATRTIKINNTDVALEEKRPYSSTHSKPSRGFPRSEDRRHYAGEHTRQRPHTSSTNESSTGATGGRPGRPSRFPPKSTGKTN